MPRLLHPGRASRADVKPAPPEARAKKTIGPPFEPGEDPRRHMKGRKSKATIAIGVALKAALANERERDENFRKLARVIWALALKGAPWAVDLIFDRLVGKLGIGIALNEIQKIVVCYPSEDEAIRLPARATDPGSSRLAREAFAAAEAKSPTSRAANEIDDMEGL